jgi:hypothetical protein
MILPIGVDSKKVMLLFKIEPNIAVCNKRLDCITIFKNIKSPINRTISEKFNKYYYKR